MAIDNRLQVFDEQGNPVDYDILASDVKFLPDGKDLPTKMAELEQEIGDAGSGDGTVTGVKVGNAPYSPDGEGVVDLSTPFNAKVDKVNGYGLSKNDYTDNDKTKLDNLPTADQLTTQLGNKANSSEIIKGISVNGQTQSKDQNGNVNIEVQGGSEVTVTQPDPADGTFTINAGDNHYTIDLKHTHENMAKLQIVDEEPSDPELDTIYAVVEDDEIKSLWIAGLEFVGGGAAPGTPAITKPSGTSINLGENDGSGVSKTIEIKANSYITGDLTVGLAANSDLSFDTTNLPSGVTYNSGAGTLTIDQLAAIQGVNITIVYSGSGSAEIQGGIIITGGGAQSKSVTVVVSLPAPVALTAIKLTGSQWLETDYKPNEKTEFQLDVKINGFANTADGQIMWDCEMNTVADTDKIFRMYYAAAPISKIVFANETSIRNPARNNEIQSVSKDAVNGVRGLIKYDKGAVTTTSSSGVQSGGTFSCGSSSVETSLKSSGMENYLKIGHGRTSNTALNSISPLEIYIYGLKIWENETYGDENKVLVRDYVPATLNGVPGLYDNTGNGAFIRSAVSGVDVVPIE